MKKAIAAILPLLVLCACPFSSPVPLTDPRESLIDASLAGAWSWVKKEGSSAEEGEVLFLVFNEHEYYIELNSVERGTPKKDRYRGFVSVFDDVRILNVRSLKGNEGFYFLRYTIAGDSLRISFVSDTHLKEKISSSGELSAAFRRHLGEKDFFEDETLFTRNTAKP